MSYIDTFDHEFLGFFGQIPLYRPLVVVDGDLESFDFGCRPDHIIMGGGSGEHPAIVFSNLEFAVAHFILSWRQASGCEDSLPWDLWIDSLASTSYKESVHFAGWSADDFYSFGMHCRSAAMNQPFRDDERALETWLASNIGELVFFSMRDLIPDFEGKLPPPRGAVGPVHGNILIPPPGFPTSGRITVDDNIVWGHPRWGETHRRANK